MADQREGGIAWCDETWNPIRGCSRVSEGCRFCYAERVAARFNNVGEPYEGLARREYHQGAYEPRWTGEVKFVKEKLEEPLRWRRPRRIFVNSMSDLFHEKVPDAWIDRIMAVMALAHWHTFQVLTKRPERMRSYFNDGHGIAKDRDRAISVLHSLRQHTYPQFSYADENAAIDRLHDGLENLWLGTSVEDQKSADARTSHLIATPAAVRFLSVEPLLERVELNFWTTCTRCKGSMSIEVPGGGSPCPRCIRHQGVEPAVDWVIVGGESGPGARPCNLEWVRGIVEQCKTAAVPVFVKQFGALPFIRYPIPQDAPAWFADYPKPRGLLNLKDKKGGDMAEWPEDLRIREFPKEVVHA